MTQKLIIPLTIPNLSFLPQSALPLVVQFLSPPRERCDDQSPYRKVIAKEGFVFEYRAMVKEQERT